MAETATATGYVYIESEPGLWTVGHYAPGGSGPDRNFHPDSDHEREEAAAARVHYLNGGYHPQAEMIPDLLTIARAYVELGELVNETDGGIDGLTLPGLPDAIAHARATLAKCGGGA